MSDNPHRSILSALALIVSCLGAGCQEDHGLVSRPAQHVVQIQAVGSGSGGVSTVGGGVDIDCTIEAGVLGQGRCTDQFADPGSRRELVFAASPDEGSVFTGWSGCSEVDGSNCAIRWTHETPDTTFTLTVQFDGN